MPDNQRKRGKLSLDEQKFIRDNIGNMKISEIAVRLNRTEAPVER